jgi:hypothetical protein
LKINSQSRKEIIYLLQEEMLLYKLPHKFWNGMAVTFPLSLGPLVSVKHTQKYIIFHQHSSAHHRGFAVHSDRTVSLPYTSMRDGTGHPQSYSNSEKYGLKDKN